MKAQLIKEIIFMALLTTCCIGASVFRLIYTDTKVFFFLNWNLFLAFIPWVITSLAIIKPNIQKSKLSVFLILSLWLLFFPNAPYILTDLFHLKSRPQIPIWFDLFFILIFAWTGLLFGFLSLWNIEIILSRYLSKLSISIISSLLLFVGSFGIYLGRYLRWNSWDLLTEPMVLIYDIGDRIINPFHHPRAWGMTFAFGLLLNIIYWSFKLIRERES
ncbi:MAG: DUF1361 domain-containing protein [Leptospiraceae bacterium]|nr:DUF1361 domain-containing protein [Leptospiraceae bacterium]